MRKKIYLDYNATTPVDNRVVDEMLPYFTEKFGNASSISHSYGWDAQEGVELARERVAKLIGAKPKGIYFTSGATESINISLLGICEANRHKGNHIITCKTEHKAVLETCEELEKRGFVISYLDVDTNGNIDLKTLHEAITDKTIMVALMHANNETGTIHPLQHVSKITDKKGILLMTDATQSIGKISFDTDDLGIDLVTFSSHKLYGPKGVGALYVRNSTKTKPIQFGGGQEKRLRPGTLNVPGIVGFGKACELCQQEMEAESSRLRLLRDRLERKLSRLDGFRINGGGSNRLPHMTNLAFEHTDGNRLIRSLKELAISQGSACTSITTEPSHVLKALGLSDELALSSIRIGLGRFTTDEEVDIAIEAIIAAVEQLRVTVS